MNHRALSLLSGGLDSILATKLMLEQGIEVEAINFVTTFCTCTRKGCQSAARAVAEKFKIPLKIVGLQEEYLKIVRNPKHGYGANMNPCLDCRVMIFTKAKEHMKDIGASFIFTGEVLGERPMSQRRDAMMLIEKESGLKGLILRPLSAKHFEPTAPEIAGIVDRNRLLDIKGRSRKPQIALAESFGINDYPCPAGGCLLTDKGFANRMRDLIKHDNLTMDETRLLKIGRHFRLSNKVKLVIGRDEEENGALEKMFRDGDIILQVRDFPSPFAVLRGEGAAGLLQDAAGIIASHTKAKDARSCHVNFWIFPGGDKREADVTPANRDRIDGLRI